MRVVVQWEDSRGFNQFLEGEKKELAGFIEALKTAGIDHTVKTKREKKTDGSGEEA